MAPSLLGSTLYEKSMFKHVILSSIFSSLIGSIIFLIICLLIYGGLAFVFGAIVFPCALICCLLFSYPLIKLTESMSEKYRFLVFFVVGFALGCASVALLFGNIDLNNLIQAKELVITYGSLGAVTSIAAWWYVRKYVRL